MIKKHKHILTVINQFDPFKGGAENVAEYLIDNSNDLSFKNDVFTVASEKIRKMLGEQKRELNEVAIEGERNFSIFRSKPFIDLNGKDRNGWMLKHYNFIKFTLGLIFIARKYDLLHAHTYYWPSAAAVIAGKITGRPVLITGHNRLSRLAEEVKEKKVPVYIIWLLKYCNKYVAIGKEIQKEAEELAGISPDKIELIYNGIDTDKYYPVGKNEKEKLRKSLNLPVDKLIVVYHGRLEEHKGIDLLLDSLSAINERGIFVIIVGTGKSEENLRNYAKTKGIEKSVLFAGFKKNASDYLKASDVYCLPSYLEGFSLSLLEAMASGLACIASDIPGNKDAIEHGDNGFLFESGSSEILTSQLKAIYEDWKTTGDKLAVRSKARDTVVSQFSLQHMVEEYRILYQAIIEHSD